MAITALGPRQANEHSPHGCTHLGVQLLYRNTSGLDARRCAESARCMCDVVLSSAGTKCVPTSTTD